ncbi:thioredoxin domain-containing protein [Streptomyces sp. NPDC047928]|uniref:thioredoxin domain-containing protein n=1 Tax=unclassified Streptomyces TaxID=2593676 RepID=UPI003717C924
MAPNNGRAQANADRNTGGNSGGKAGGDPGATARRTLRTAVLTTAALALAVGGGVGWYAARSTDDPTSVAASENAGADVAKPFVKPANTTGQDGTVVTYGKADAKHTLSVWLDPRCPYCAGLEMGLGKVMKEQADQGLYKIEYHFATFLDGTLGGKGSKRTVNALGAAVNESPEKFHAYLGVLYSNHPEKESDDKFGSTSTLLKLADQVPGLRSPAFNKAVKELTYMPWVDKVSAAFYESGVTGTPVVKLDGKELDVLSGKGIDSITPDAYKALVEAELKG